jgi:hypothetical protein
METRLDIQEDSRKESSTPTIVDAREKDECILISTMLITATILTECMLAMAGYAAGRAIDESSDVIKILSTLAVMLIASGFIVSSTLMLKKQVPEDMVSTSVNPASFFSRANKTAHQYGVILAPLSGSVIAICLGGLMKRFFRESDISTFRPDVTQLSTTCAVAFLGFSIPVVATFIALRLMKKSPPTHADDTEIKLEETTPLTLMPKRSYSTSK